MPPPSVPRKVKDIIFYYYAKLIIARSAGFEENYGFIIDTYKRLRDGQIMMSDYEREILHLSKLQQKCAFCGISFKKCEPVHVVPRSYGVPPGMNNLVMTCLKCGESKNQKDLIHWWCEELGKESDSLPRIPLAIYLKIAYELHKVNFSLLKPCEGLADVFALLQRKKPH